MSFESLSPVRFAGVSQVTASLGVNDPEVGTFCREGDEDYVFVYNAGNSQISVGQGAVMSGVTGYSVTVSSVTMLDFLVGVCKHATLTTGTYGWLIRKGFSQVQMGANDSCTTGGLLALAVDGSFALKTISTGYISPVVAKAMTGAASGTSCHAYISVY